MDSSFCFNGNREFLEGGNIRTKASGDPLGALGDLGECTAPLLALDATVGLCLHAKRAKLKLNRKR